LLRISIFPACLLILLSQAAPAGAQTGQANVVTPAPPPREGTVGPEQLRDFSLPGTRQTPPATDTPPATTPAPAPAERPAPSSAAPASPPRAAAEAPRRSDTVALPEAAPAATAAEPATRPLPHVTVGLDAPPTPAPVTAPVASPSPLLPESSAAPSASDQDEGRLSWWPWALAAALAGIALAVWLRRRERQGYGRQSTGEEPLAAAPPLPEPAARTPAPPSPAPAPAPAAPPQPPLPSGLVTTRLRSASPTAPAPAQRPPAPVGGVVSTRLRPWIDLDLALSEVLLTATEAVLRFRLAVANSGSGSARDIVIEALALNAGDNQAKEIANFYARPAASEAGIDQLPRASATELTHEVRMPRSAIREYEAQGRRLFVPIIAFNAVYRWGPGTGRTSAAFLVGHGRPGAERLAPLQLHDGPARLGSLGVRRLDEFVRS